MASLRGAHFAVEDYRAAAEVLLNDEDVIQKATKRIDLRPLVASSRRKNVSWRFTTDAPAGDEAWTALAFDDSSWRDGEGPFAFGVDNPVRTSWNSSDIWLRHEFELEDAVEGPLVFLARIDDMAEFYVNGVPAAQGSLAPPSSYYDPQTIDGTEAARQALRPGKNILAVHGYNVGGPSVIDVGLYARGNEALEFLSRLVATGSESSLVRELRSRMYAEAGDWKRAFADQKRLRAAEGATEWEPSRVKALLPPGSPWRYFDQGAVVDSSWRQPDFDDGAWKEGQAPLGYGDASVLETGVGFGPDPNKKHATTYFRRTFNVDRSDRFSALRVYLRRDDAAGSRLCETASRTPRTTRRSASAPSRLRRRCATFASRWLRTYSAPAETSSR